MVSSSFLFYFAWCILEPSFGLKFLLFKYTFKTLSSLYSKISCRSLSFKVSIINCLYILSSFLGLPASPRMSSKDRKKAAMNPCCILLPKTAKVPGPGETTKTRMIKRTLRSLVSSFNKDLQKYPPKSSSPLWFYW